MRREVTYIKLNLHLNIPNPGRGETHMMEGTNTSSRDDTRFDFYKRNAELLAKQGEHARAVDMYTKALCLHPTDRHCMLHRSRCHMMVGHFQEALQDAEDCLKSHADDYQGIFQKAEVMYMIGEFEASLALYQRANQLKNTDDSRKGVHKVKQALNTIFPPPITKSKSSTNRQNRSTNMTCERGSDHHAYTRKHLGNLYTDKLFLQKLIRDIDPSNKISSQIHDIAKRGLAYLDTRTRFWHQREPMHARRRFSVFSARAESAAFQRKSPSPIQDNQDSTKDQTTSEVNKDEALKMHTNYIVEILKRIDHEQSAGRYEKSLKLAKECLKMVENLNQDELPNKYEMASTLHSCVGNALLEMNKYDAALRHHQKDLQLAEEGYTTMIMSIEEARSRALDNIGRVYARMGKFQEAIDTWERKINLTESPIEKMWLAHEIGRCLFELRKYPEAHAYGQMSLTLAQECHEMLWQINATVLIAQTQVHLGKFEIAIELFEEAATLSEIQGDEEAVATLTTAIRDLKTKISS